MSVLWVCNHVPFPMLAGDRVYSAQLISAVARTGLDVTVLGLAGGGAPKAIGAPNSEPRWRPVAVARRGTLQALCHPLPLVAARCSPRPVRSAFKELFKSAKPRVVVMDNYASGWVLDTLREMRARVPLVYIAHNFEEKLAHHIAVGFRGSPARKAALVMNWAKIRRLERRMVRQADLVVTLTERDRVELLERCPEKPALVLPPGFNGPRCETRAIDASTPRRVVMLGSVRWIAKQINVAEFLAVADRMLSEGGIQFDIIGDVDEKFQAEWQPKVEATRFRGFVDDLSSELANARLGLIIEAVGGGFKLKILDYLFSRVPVAALEGSFEGLPPAALANIVTEPSASKLAETVLRLIDDFGTLNRMQSACYAAVEHIYDWDANGRKLAEGLARLS